MNDVPGPPPVPAPPPGPPHSAPLPDAVMDALTVTDVTEIRTGATSGRGGLATRAVAVVAGLGLLGGGLAFAASQLGGDDGSPESAVEDLLQAVADEDVLGVLAALEPGERDIVIEPLQSMAESLRRTEVLADDFRLDGIDGIDLDFADLEFRVEPVRDDLARVYFAGGTVTGTFNSDELPMGSFLTDTLDRFEVEYRGLSETSTESVVSEGDDSFLVAHRTGDGWKVSVGYTAAEAARLDAGAPVPEAGTGMVAIGADSPEGAVAGFIDDAIALDPDRLLARLSPAEFGALHDYWGVLGMDTGGPVDPGDDFEIVLDRLDLSSDVDGSRASVYVDGFAVSITVRDGFDELDFVIDQSGSCISVSGSGIDTITDDPDFEELGIDLTEPVCSDDLEELSRELGASSGLGMDFGSFGTGFGAAAPGVKVGITTTRIDGRWFIAPISTTMDLMAASLSVLERDDLDATLEGIESFVDSFSSTFFGFGPGGLNGAIGDSGFDDFEDFDESDFEDFEPDLDPSFIDPDAEQGMRTLIASLTSSPASAECVYDTLVETASFNEFFDLAFSYEFDYEPDPSSQEVLFQALEVCTN